MRILITGVVGIIGYSVVIASISLFLKNHLAEERSI